MKKLNNSLFKKLEPNKIHNLSKIVGGVGEIYCTNYKGSNGSTGSDDFQVGYCNLHYVPGIGNGDIICMD